MHCAKSALSVDEAAARSPRLRLVWMAALLAGGAIVALVLMGALAQVIGLGGPLPPAQMLIAAAMLVGFASPALGPVHWHTAGEHAALSLCGLALVAATAL